MAKLTGAPTAAATSSFQVLAAYKSKAGQQAYQVMVADVCAAQNQSYPYQQGLQVFPSTGENSGLEQRWGQHHFTGEPTLSGGLYTLQPYTYLGVAGSPNAYSGTRTVPQATFDAYRWAVFVR